MQIIFHKRTYIIFITSIIILSALYLFVVTFFPSTPDWTTKTVSQGEVTQTVSVSGFIEAKNTADLAFPAVGIVTAVLVDEGSLVKKGDLLATIASNQLVAQRSEAVASLQIAQAQYTQTQSGVTQTQKEVTQTTVRNAEANLVRVKTEQTEKVRAAQATLLSSNLEAITTNTNNSAVAPTISGTYTCTDEGSYFIDIYASRANSNYSYTVTGLTTDTASVSTKQKAPIGTCGLYIQFDDASFYNNSQWDIAVPNTHSATYITNKNTYELALQQQKNAVANAEDVLRLARTQAQDVYAPARTEVVAQKNGAVAQAQARVAQIDAMIQDHSIIAPFEGVITNVAILEGETATTQPVITLLSNDTFEMTALIPEIDITKIALNQKVHTVFDAKTDEVQTGTIAYVAPVATEIDGVAYFKTTITLDEAPEWIRSGLNADVEIIISRKTDVIRLSSRFISTDPTGTTYVQKVVEDSLVDTPITITDTGSDGYVAITGLSVGDTVVAPTLP